MNAYPPAFTGSLVRERQRELAAAMTRVHRRSVATRVPGRRHPSPTHRPAWWTRVTAPWPGPPPASAFSADRASAA